MQKSSYTNEEIAAVQRKFSAAMLRHRNRQRNIALGFIAIIGGGVLVYFVVPGDYLNPIILLCFAVLAVYIFAVTKMYPPLKCSGCFSQLEESFGNYCPECGSYPLKVIGEYERECKTCNRHLRITRHRHNNDIPRNYKIRVCTFCGVTLSRSGF